MSALESAWLEIDGRLHFARAPRVRAGVLDSAVLRLMDAVWRTYPRQARRLLRRPIHATDALNPLDWGLVRVAAKRLRSVTHEEAASRLADPAAMNLCDDATKDVVSRLETSDEARVRERAIVQDPWPAIHALEELAEQGSERYLSDRRLGAILFDPEGRPLAAAVNRSARHRLEHAEFRALRQGLAVLGGRGLPPGSVLYCSLKPCRMCAGALLQAAEDPARVQVYYRDFDPGPAARATFLNRDSFDRARLGSPWLSLPELETQVRLPDAHG